MNVRFGNLSVLEFEQKTSIALDDEDFTWMNERRTDTADFRDDDKFHIFNLPLGIVAGSNVGEELVKRLKKYNFEKHFYVETKESGF